MPKKKKGKAKSKTSTSPIFTLERGEYPTPKESYFSPTVRQALEDRWKKSSAETENSELLKQLNKEFRNKLAASQKQLAELISKTGAQPLISITNSEMTSCIQLTQDLLTFWEFLYFHSLQNKDLTADGRTFYMQQAAIDLYEIAVPMLRISSHYWRNMGDIFKSEKTTTSRTNETIFFICLSLHHGVFVNQLIKDLAKTNPINELIFLQFPIFLDVLLSSSMFSAQQTPLYFQEITNLLITNLNEKLPIPSEFNKFLMLCDTYATAVVYLRAQKNHEIAIQHIKSLASSLISLSSKILQDRHHSCTHIGMSLETPKKMASDTVISTKGETVATVAEKLQIDPKRQTESYTEVTIKSGFDQVTEGEKRLKKSENHLGTLQHYSDYLSHLQPAGLVEKDLKRVKALINLIEIQHKNIADKLAKEKADLGPSGNGHYFYSSSSSTYSDSSSCPSLSSSSSFSTNP